MRVLLDECVPRGLRRELPDHEVKTVAEMGWAGITADTALRLFRYFGNSAQFWMNLQTRYDLAVAEEKSGGAIAAQVQRAGNA